MKDAEQSRSVENRKIIGDDAGCCSYLVDTETFELKFVNHNMKQFLPNVRLQTRCYETIRNRTTPCEDCPIAALLQSEEKEVQTELYVECCGLWTKMTASLISVAKDTHYALLHWFSFGEYFGQNCFSDSDLRAFTKDTSLYDALALSTDDYIYMCDMSKNLFYFPSAMVEEFDLPGQVLEDAIPIWGERIHENDRESYFSDLQRMLSGETDLHNQEYRARNKDGHWVWLRCRGHLQRNRKGEPTLFAGVITLLGKKTNIDVLTGLPDKYALELQVCAKMEVPVPAGSLLLLGLDNFKYINNLYGWEYGDEVLCHSAERLQELLPNGIQLYRLDSDKFGVFFAHATAEEVEAYFQNVFLEFQHQRSLDDRSYRCTVSGGYAVVEETPEDFCFATLFKQAEYALDYAKAEGKNRLNRYNEQLMSGKKRMLSLMEELQESVNQGFEGFEVYYQPQVDAKTQEVLSAEALLRWKCDKFGSVTPVEFIPLLEQTGLIQKVGLWVLCHAAQTCKKWRKIRPDFSVNVNISFAQLRDQKFLPTLSELVEAQVIEPKAIHLELTESCITAGSLHLTAAFRQLRGMGFLIEMDDFGTGYSSLEVLKNAPADVVKIDRAFVRDITHSDFDATFIQFVVSLCHSVNISVCLEGVEFWAEYDLVKPMGLDLIQGYLFGRPQPMEDFERNFLAVGAAD